jgi:hypothetical protein
VPELQARARLHDTILCRNRLRRLAGFCRDEARRHTKAPAARPYTAETARCPQARFLLQVTASQAILSRDQAPPDDS